MVERLMPIDSDTINLEPPIVFPEVSSDAPLIVVSGATPAFTPSQLIDSETYISTVPPIMYTVDHGVILSRYIDLIFNGEGCYKL